MANINQIKYFEISVHNFRVMYVFDCMTHIKEYFIDE